MNPLPSPPADPLHILPPTSLLVLAALAALLLLVMLLVALQNLVSRGKKSATTTPPVPRETPTPGLGVNLAERLRALEEKTLQTKAFRDGCHDLAELAKTHLGQRTGLDAERMTSAEIGRVFDAGKVSAPDVAETKVAPFLNGLSRRRYGRTEPRRRDFVAACDEARDVLSAGASARPAS